MRKELLVYVSTTERGEEISITSVSKNRLYVLINTIGGKVTANRSELLLALQSIEEFDKINNTNVVDLNLVPEIPVIEDVEYVDEE